MHDTLLIHMRGRFNDITHILPAGRTNAFDLFPFSFLFFFFFFFVYHCS